MALVIANNTERVQARRLQRAAETGELRRLHSGVYTDDLKGSPESIVRRELYSLCAILAPGAIISHRSALESGPSAAGELFLTGAYRRDIKLPGVRLRIAQGHGPLDSDIRIPTAHGATHRASDGRALLENLQASRATDARRRRTLGSSGVERWLEQLLARNGERSLNRVREQARGAAKSLRLNAELKQLDNIIGALLGTREQKLSHPQAIARARGKPYDGERAERFGALAEYLHAHPPRIPVEKPSVDPLLQAFVESYFSNFIEGTEFELAEAHEIVVVGRPMRYREDDSHDILGTYHAILDSAARPYFPADFDSFLLQLKTWNRQVIFSRSEKQPGEIKEKPNRAGNTLFVAPELVVGTLEKGFEHIAAAHSAEVRAALVGFVVGEVHPFNDGNGRTARLAMNLALSADKRTRLIVPTVLRDDYIPALKALSTHGHCEPYVRMLNRVAEFSAWLNYRSQEACFKQLAKSHAMEDPQTARLTMKS